MKQFTSREFQSYRYYINIIVSIAIANYKNNKYENNRTKSRALE